MSFSHPGILSSTKPWPTLTFSTIPGIYSDATYYYYRLTSTGTVTITNSPIAMDILVIGGGGGGGYAFAFFGSPGGGGGAGAYAYFENIQISENTQCSYTIGAGGAGGVFGDGGGKIGSPSVFQIPLSQNSTQLLIAPGGGGGGGNNGTTTSMISPTTGGSGGGAGGTFSLNTPQTFFGAPAGAGSQFGQYFINAGGNNTGTVYDQQNGALVTTANGAAGGGGAGSAGFSNTGRSGGEGGTGKIAFDYSTSSIFKVAGGGGGGGNAMNPGLNYVADNSTEFGGGVGGAFTDNPVSGAVNTPAYVVDSSLGNRVTWRYYPTSGTANKGGGGGGSELYGSNTDYGITDWPIPTTAGSGGSGVVFLRVLRSAFGE